MVFSLLRDRYPELQLLTYFASAGVEGQITLSPEYLRQNFQEYESGWLTLVPPFAGLKQWVHLQAPDIYLMLAALLKI